MKAEARQWLLEHPADQWRLGASMRTNPVSGVFEDDMTAFFGRRPNEVSDADIYRWRACCDALRDLRRENR